MDKNLREDLTRAIPSDSTCKSRAELRLAASAESLVYSKSTLSFLSLIYDTMANSEVHYHTF
ncbi:hypothetical protein KIN20_001023 [Parelaphostrongylus tenuis]|uniref:Uncharacterized protein n=1 Tax=Parelaphostrongylus tenuis TaxID=148309 RepID=A0AAD5QE74_PARTN|nr:hypothetical protein KIN20_001023 [Parelaphostrongylus tenuis]